MKKITPFVTKEDAIKKLDNGGRFYNLLTKADDGEINQSELAKVGGLFGDKQQMILFLELSISLLSKEEKKAIISKLDTSLFSHYQINKAQHLLPSEAKTKGKIANNAIVTGIPKLIESKTNFNGFIMVPIMAGSVTTFSMIPLIDQYDVYELRGEFSDEHFLIAHTKGNEKLPPKKIQVAGILKELQKEEKNTENTEKFLEALYWLE